MRAPRTTLRFDTQTFGSDDGLLIERTLGYQCARFVLTGIIDIRTAPHLMSLLTQDLADPAVSVMVVDMAAVKFFGAAGLRALDHAARRAAAHGVRITVWEPPFFVRRVLETANFEPPIFVEPLSPH